MEQENQKFDIELVELGSVSERTLGGQGDHTDGRGKFNPITGISDD